MEPPPSFPPSVSLAMTDPQKQYADAVIEVLPTQLIPDDNEGKVLRVKLIMKEGVKFFNPVYLFDEGSTINWIPCGRKLTCSYPGIKFSYGPDTYFGQEVLILVYLPFCVQRVMLTAVNWIINLKKPSK